MRIVGAKMDKPMGFDSPADQQATLSLCLCQDIAVGGEDLNAGKTGKIAVICDDLNHPRVTACHDDRFTAVMDRVMPSWQQSRVALNREPLGYEGWGY